MARRPPPPEPVADQIVDIDITSEMQGSFLEYAYSVIYSRALPDARDGLKPVQRRILYTMAEMGLRPDRAHVKSARVVGEVMGKLHPHGDAAIYDALVRMAQPFSLRLPLVNGHGNFGSLDDGPAAYRYTECRMDPAALPMVAGLDEEVVDFAPNYDGREIEPVVLPAAFPNLLVNGASGIAVGMATNMAPHNLGEVIAAARHLLAHPEATADELMRLVPGPDLPTGGRIVGLDGIREAYHTGRGTFRMRATARVEQVTARANRPGHHRAAVERRPGEGHRADPRAAQRQADRRDRRRHRPHRRRAGAAPGHRAQERVRAGGGPGAAVPAHPPGGVLRDQQRDPGRGPAADAGAQGAAGGLPGPSARGRPPAQPVPPRGPPTGSTWSTGCSWRSSTSTRSSR